MRVLLVQAFTALDMELVYPIGLAYLAAHLDGHDVRIFDVNLHTDPNDALRRELELFEPEVVGLSLRNIKVATPGTHADDFEPQQRTVQCVRESLPGATIILGGTAFSLYAEQFMRRLPEADLGVWGEAEHRLPRLLQDLEHPEFVRGVYHRVDGELQYSGPPAALDIRSLRHPRRDLVDHAPYVASSPMSVGVSTKRGCALRCIHCSDTFLLGTIVRQREPSDVVDEIQMLVEEYGVDTFFFCDPIFNIPVAHALAVCREITDRRLDVKWSGWLNEHRNTLPDELIAAMKQSGCRLLSFSPDHVDDRMLIKLDKNFRHVDLLHTIEIAKRHDMDVEYSFFLNSPDETLRSLLAIYVFLARAKWELGPRLRPFTLLMMQPIRLYPHTRLAALAREHGLIGQDDDLIDGRFWNPGHLQHAVTAWQRSAALAWRIRQRTRRAGTRARG
jgi:putative variant cofactor biosynthesis B12-binding/radical SAM domain protein 1